MASNILPKCLPYIEAHDVQPGEGWQKGEEQDVSWKWRQILSETCVLFNSSQLVTRGHTILDMRIFCVFLLSRN